LIQVPALPAQGRVSRRSTVRPGTNASRRRRRLRREVRVAAYALAAAAPLFLVATMLWAVQPPRTLASAAPGKLATDKDDRGTLRPPSISISIEPTILTPYAEVEPPVVFPGYLLPDDGREEPANAGS
jgi:hypothetical protein